MGGYMSAPPKPEFRVIMTAVGRATTPTGARSKSKIYLLEDNKLVLVYANGSETVREEYAVSAASFRNGNARFDIATGGSIMFAKASCNCGMGNVAYAGITADGYEARRSVRPPEWVTGL